MAANREKDKNTWEAQFYYTDWTGKRKKKHKRGFPTKKAALEWEREFLEKSTRSLDMLFESFIELYYDYKENVKDNRRGTMNNKRAIINKHILPYFKEKKMSEVSANDIHEWQKTIKAMGYKDTYLRSLNSNLSGIFNHAVKFYNLDKNPCQIAGTMGSKNADEMQFWTLEEFRKFIPSIADKPRAQVGIELLFWTGMRVGELCALTPADFSSENKTVRINKTWQVIDGEEVIGPPKSKNGNRIVTLPEAISNKLVNYINMLYDCPDDERIFEGSGKHFFAYEIKRGCEISGVKRIRVHDLRHSHVSFLIEQGFNDYTIAQRIGDTVNEVRKTYAHLYPDKDKDLAIHLDSFMI